jgi:hypothetical protein
MQSICWHFVVLMLSVLVVNGEQIENKDILSISSGTSFGRCVGYCRQSINIMSNPFQVIASREPNFNQGSFPPTNVIFPLNSTEWIDVVSLLNLDTFQSLDDRIGCPDCADGGAEWVQIDWNNGNKRVTFENRQTVKGIEKLIEKLREMRQIYFYKM